jgi:hypothetical protein
MQTHSDSHKNRIDPNLLALDQSENFEMLVNVDLASANRLSKMTELNSENKQVSSSFEQLEQYLDLEEKQVELLERLNTLQRRKRKQQKQDWIETWVIRWIASPIAYLVPAQRREEWLGDLYEVTWEMRYKKHYPLWFVNMVNLGQSIILIISASKIQILDILKSSIKKISK